MKHGGHTTGEEIAKDFAERAKNISVFLTGANTGLVTITCRSQEKVDETVAKLKALALPGQVDGVAIELSSLASVRAGAEAFIKTGKPLNVLINNAGIMGCPLAHTKEGFESQFGVNHLSHFHLTNLLLPLLQAASSRGETARVVNVSSLGHFLMPPPHGISLDDLQAARSYNPWVRYGESKLANVLHAKEVTRRFLGPGEGKGGVVAVSLHPGNIAETDLKRNAEVSSFLLAFLGLLANPRGLWAVITSPHKNTAQGVSTTLLAALTPTPEPGGDYSDCQVETSAVHPTASDADLARRLWEASEAAVAGK